MTVVAHPPIFSRASTVVWWLLEQENAGCSSAVTTFRRTMIPAVRVAGRFGLGQTKSRSLGPVVGGDVHLMFMKLYLLVFILARIDQCWTCTESGCRRSAVAAWRMDVKEDPPPATIQLNMHNYDSCPRCRADGNLTQSQPELLMSI